MREFLKGLGLEDEIVEKIIAEHGKIITKDKDTIIKDKETINLMKQEIQDLKESSKSNTELQEKYDKLIAQVESENKKKKDEIDTANILKAIGDVKFVNDYTKNSIISEVKSAIADENNSSKTVKDLFDEITKDKEGIFANPNKPEDMPSSNPSIYNAVDKDAFSKMGYQERLNLKAENPDLFAKLNNNE